ncbi:hypothetical protein [Streptomyces sp. NPDC060065]|uniref:hypothetical protein n=1 Tax=Streptomyces sp. NPDC060065 TaxID=3347050 RepID=UPI0036AB45F2
MSTSTTTTAVGLNWASLASADPNTVASFYGAVLERGSPCPFGGVVRNAGVLLVEQADG